MLTTLIGLVIAAQTTVHVDGDGFLRFVGDGNKSLYAKEAVLTVNDGRLSHERGFAVYPRMQISGSPSSLRIDLEGHVFATYSGVEQRLEKSIVLAIFPDDVRPVVENGFVVSSFRPARAVPGINGAGVIRTGKLGQGTATPVTTSNGLVKITLYETAEVATGNFTLGDIAEISADPATKLRLEAVEISRAPVLGSTFRMSHSMVKSRLRRHDKNVDKYEMVGPNQIAITQKGQTVTHAQFIEAAIAEASTGLAENSVLKSARQQKPLIAPLGDLELVSENVSSSGSRISVVIAIYIDGKRYNSRTVSLENHNPISKMRIGQSVKVLVKSSAATVQTTGKIRSIDPSTNTVLVKTVTGAELLCTVIETNIVEVQL